MIPAGLVSSSPRAAEEPVAQIDVDCVLLILLILSHVAIPNDRLVYFAAAEHGSVCHPSGFLY